jgi:ribosomal protein L40E
MMNTSDYLKPRSKNMKLKNANKEVGSKVTTLRQKRVCLKCGGKFPSKGPYNRVCDKCSSMNERVANSTYAVREKAPSEPSTVEKRFYGFN